MTRSLLSNSRFGISAVKTLPRRPVYVSRRTRKVYAAESDPEVDPKTFDEGAAQVRRLMSRDRSKYSGPDFEVLLEKQFVSDTAADVVSEESEVEEKKTQPMTSFKNQSAQVVNPFGTSAVKSTKPVDIAAEKDIGGIDNEPWWSFFKKITVTQIVLLCSFTLIITSVFGAFTFVLNSGAIHFNE